jgi:NDP-sugar pyrophosphorylase family protein
MRAMVLCAGRGTRMGRLGEDLPKPLLDINGRPILDRVLANLARWGFRDVVLNLHHHGERIREFVADGSRWGLRIHFRVEPELVGTAGSVRDAAALLAGEDPVLVHYGDVVTDQDLGALVRAHRAAGALATLLLHRRPGSNSVVVVDPGWRVRRLLERPTPEERAGVDSPWVNSGVYLLDPRLPQGLPGPGPLDFPRDVFPGLIAQGRVVGVPLTGYRCAVDSPERLEQARRELRDVAWP